MLRPTRLKSGLTIYQAPVAGTATVTVLVLVRAGSKYETKRTNGLSHFLEHMLFKGTARRPTAREVAEVLDGVGGEYNAFTDKERTGYYARVNARHCALAIDWVADMLLNSLLDPTELEREKTVIQQEISMYYDTPTSYIDDVFAELLYGDQPAGWDIAGTKETVARTTRNDLVKYLQLRYVAKETTVIVAGNLKGIDVARTVERHFADLRRGSAPTKRPVRERQSRPGIHLKAKDTDQAHLMLGVRGFSAYDSRRYPLAVMATILGGNMSSRLFTTLREQHGLAYYVATGAHHYTDTGYLATSAGVPTNKIKEAVQIIVREYERLRDILVTPEELAKAKEYVKGRTVMGLESSSAVASFVGDQALLYGKVESIDTILKRIERVTSDDIRAVARTIFTNNRLNLALIAPSGSTRGAERVLRFT